MLTYCLADVRHGHVMSFGAIKEQKSTYYMYMVGKIIKKKKWTLSSKTSCLLLLEMVLQSRWSFTRLHLEIHSAAKKMFMLIKTEKISSIPCVQSSMTNHV